MGLKNISMIARLLTIPLQAPEKGAFLSEFIWGDSYEKKHNQKQTTHNDCFIHHHPYEFIRVFFLFKIP